MGHPWDSSGKITGVGCHCLLHREDKQVQSFQHSQTVVSTLTQPRFNRCKWCDQLLMFNFHECFQQRMSIFLGQGQGDTLKENNVSCLVLRKNTDFRKNSVIYWFIQQMFIECIPYARQYSKRVKKHLNKTVKKFLFLRNTRKARQKLQVGICRKGQCKKPN